LEEARTLARFKHPNIVQVHRCFEAHGTAYIVMEFVEGETLNDYLKRAGKPKEEFLRGVIVALLDGLAAVHRAGFMYRDIKPGNIILNTQGAPVLVDFGSARQDVGSRSITSVVTPGLRPSNNTHHAASRGRGRTSMRLALWRIGRLPARPRLKPPSEFSMIPSNRRSKPGGVTTRLRFCAWSTMR